MTDKSAASKTKDWDNKPLGKRLEILLQRGDVGKILDEIKRERYSIQHSEHYRKEYSAALERALRDLGDRDPAELVKFTMSRLLSFQSWMLLRAQFVAETEIRETDASQMGSYLDVSNNHVVLNSLDRVKDIQQEIMKTCQVMARISHVFEIAHEKAVTRKSRKVIDLEQEREREADEGPVGKTAGA